MKGLEEVHGSVHKYLNDSFRFMQLSKYERNAIGDFTKDFNFSASLILKNSKEMRKSIQIVRSDVNIIVEREAKELLDNQLDALDQLDEMLTLFEKSWHLCEVFILNPTKNVSLEMSRWLKTSSFPFPFNEYVQAIRHNSQPELCNNIAIDDIFDKSPNYWDTIYDLLLRGQNNQVVTLLQLHSEIAEALLVSQTNLERKVVSSHRQSSIDSRQCELLFECILSHPYISFINEELYDTDNLPIAIASQFQDWRNSVNKLRNSNMSLLIQIPQLDTILRILLGELSTLEEISRCEWTSYTLGLLLYVYPPPLTKASLSKIVEEALSLHHQRHAMNDRESIAIRNMREIMMGNLGPLMRSLYETNRQHFSSNNGAIKDISKSDSFSKCIQEMMSLVALVSVTNLTQLLVKSVIKSELAEPNPSYRNECSFAEELLLESAVRLNNAEFPLEMVAGYLSKCPIQGSHYFRRIIPMRPIRCDNDAIEIANILRSNGFENEASSVLIARGMWWLRKSIHTSKKVGHHHPTSMHGISTVPKAISFFQLAGESGNNMIYELIDQSLWRCCKAVVESGFFEGINITPSAPIATPPHRTGLNPSPHVIAKGYEMKSDSIRGNESRMITDEQEEKLNEDQAKLRQSSLLEAINEANDVISTIIELSNDEVASLSPPTQNVSKAALAKASNALQNYFTSVNFAIAGLAAVTDVDRQHNFVQAARLLANLIADEHDSNQTKPIVSMRYWLHILDVIAWLSTAIIQLSQKPLLEPILGNSSSANHANTNNIGILFTKGKVCMLMKSLEEVTGSYNSSFYTNNIKPEYLQSIRLSLMGLLTASIIQDNSNIRKSNENDENSNNNYNNSFKQINHISPSKMSRDSKGIRYGRFNFTSEVLSGSIF
eukprot:gene4794-6721_t